MAGEFLRFLAQKRLCFHCHEPMKPTPVRKKRNGDYDKGWTREHIVPKSKGGRKGDNIVLAHYKCNQERGNVDPTLEMIERAKVINAIASEI